MWRAFFYAVGTMLMILGIQCILVGQFNISSEASIPKLAKRFTGGIGGNSGSDETDRYGLSNDLMTDRGPASAGGYGGRPGQASAFGASRFGDRNVGNDRFFAANNNSPNNGRTAFANYSNQNKGLDAINSSDTMKTRLRVQPIKTEDWMPWSLIAAGAIVLIYTHSFERRSME